MKSSYKSSSFSVLGGFFARAIASLAITLVLWYFAREWVIQPVAWLAHYAVDWFFPVWATGVELEGTDLLLITSLRVPNESSMIAELTPDVAVLTYCYGLPLWIALLMAARSKGFWWKAPLGALILVPFQTWGVCFKWLVMASIHLVDTTGSATGFNSWEMNGIALGYQLGYLLFPAMVPTILWLLFERDFINTVVLEGSLIGALSGKAAKSIKAEPQPIIEPENK